MDHGTSKTISTGSYQSKCSFDTVDHNILLNVLENKFGESDKALE